jgi:hypothetical protein
VKLDSKQAAGFDRDAPQIEQLAPAAGRRPSARQHRVAREEAGEHHDVAEQEDPETVAGDDPLRRRTRHRLSIADLAHR